MDSEGYSIPPPVHDLGASSSALPDDNTEEHQQQFKVEIKNDVIHEEEEEADAALSKVANTLRAVCALAIPAHCTANVWSSNTPFLAKRGVDEMPGMCATPCSSLVRQI
jgi:hypothetical protein